jgi:hypothetical protein
MSIDTAAPRTRRAIIAGAFGAVLGSIGIAAKPPVARAGTDGDVVLDATNTAAGTTVINGNGSSAVFRVANADEDGIQAISANGVGLLGGSGDTSFPSPIEASTGVFGISVDGHGVYAASDSNAGLYAANNASTVAAIVAEGDPGTAIHGHGGPGPVPASPASTGIFASAVGEGHGISSWVEDGIALQALSTGSIAILASGEEDGIAGASSGNRTGVVGWSSDQLEGVAAVPPAGPAKTGVYGEATQDADARGVSGKSTSGHGVHGDATSGHAVHGDATTGHAVHGAATSGRGVQGAATTGVGVRAEATLGVALDVDGRAVFSRSGRASVPAGAMRVDVTVPGGLDSNANVLATLQIKRGKVHVVAARPNYPSSGKVRIYLSDVASTTVATPLAWFVLG